MHTQNKKAKKPENPNPSGCAALQMLFRQRRKVNGTLSGIYQNVVVHFWSVPR